MEKYKVKILVACHKPGKVFQNDVYMPIHVGRSVSHYKKEMCSLIGDNNGENISEKNPYYCELTAQYWAWKNLNTDYIGLCHYRRYFCEEITENNVDDLLSDYDIIMTKRLYLQKSIYNWLKDEFLAEDMYIFVSLLKKMYPQYIEHINQFFFKNNIIHPCNMFVCKKSLFDEFADWQFSFLFELEKILRFSGYSRAKRIMGYFGETLLNLFFVIKKSRIKEIPIVSMIGDKEVLLYQSPLRKMFNTLDYWYSISRNKNDNYAVESGLKVDGIYDILMNWK